VDNSAAYKTSCGREDATVSLDHAATDQPRDDDSDLACAQAEHTSRITARILQDVLHTDLSIEDPPLSDVIERVFVAMDVV